MKIVDDVFKISNEFIRNSEYVDLNEEGIERTAEEMLKNGKLKFTKPVEITDANHDTHYRSTMKQLVGGAINYCYWYGKSDIRPNGCSASKMFEAVERAATKWHETINTDLFFSALKQNLILGRFPLLEERLKHIEEIEKNGWVFVEAILRKHNKEDSFNYLFPSLLRLFPGYASDIFLKRASLFFMMLYRMHGWFAKDMYHCPVPADYQVPKMLLHYGCINYTEELWTAIMNHTQIPKGSLAECEIRAATILACKKLCELTGWNAADVDGWFWLQRNECNDPFHLTITTDY